MSFEQTDAGGLAKDLSKEFGDLAIGNASNSARGRVEVVPKPEGEQTGTGKCGDCYIFDYQEFLQISPEEIEPRPGSEHDAARLKHDFTALNFNVCGNLDLTKEQTLNVLKQAAKKDHTQSKYFVCCFLTHGTPGKLLMHDTTIEIDEILQCFSRSACKTLSGKPKIFIFEACRGSSCEDGVPIDSTNRLQVKVPSNSADLAPVKASKNPTNFGSVMDNPDYLDFLIAYSTYEGKYSFKTKARDPGCRNNHGSYFIDELCRTIEQFSDKLDLLQILTITNYRMAYLFETKYTSVEEYRNKKQMPCFTSKLRTDVKFNRKIQMFESQHTQYFDNRRRETNLGKQSTDKPLEDEKTFNIENTKRIKILFLFNTRKNFENLSTCAGNLWASAANNDYQREDMSNWSEKEIMAFLKDFKSRDFTNTDCFICVIACKAKGDNLCDVNGYKFSMRRITEQFTGVNCPALLQKPKIFIFLLTSPPKKSFFPSWLICGSSESTDGESESEIMIPEHADILEVAITIKTSKQLDGVKEKFCEIFGGESSEDFLSQLTRMNAELVREHEFNLDTDNGSATFCLNSTLTKTLILNNS